MIITDSRGYSMENRIPVKRSSPGRILKKELDARGWTQKDFAEIIGRPEQVISEIINGTKQITPETAIEFSRAIGTSPEFWHNLEANYQLWLAYKSGDVKPIERRAQLFKLVPVSELKKKGWLPNTTNFNELEKSYLDLMGIKSVDTVPTCPVFKRQSVVREGGILPEVIWIKRIEKLISGQKLKKYDPDRFRDAINDLLELCLTSEGVKPVPKFFLEHGIHFAIAPHLNGTKIDGAYFKFKNSPVIALSLRYDRIDSFWFTLMHEVAHLISDNAGNIIETTRDRDNAVSDLEKMADEIASDWLVEDKKYKAFVAETRPFFSKSKITEFANQINRHPGLVLGRLQYDGLVPWKNLRNLTPKVKYYLLDYFDKPF